MGEGLDQIYAYCSDDELGESSSLSGGSDDESDSNSHHHNNNNNNKDSSSVHGLSSLVSQLPIKKGLSKFYQGKSQSLSSFSNITSVEDLAKKETADPLRRRKMMKPSRSYAVGLDDETAHGPPTTTTKKKNGPLMRVSSSYCGSSIPRTASGCSFFATTKLPPIPMNNNM